MSSEPPNTAFVDTSVCYNYTFNDDGGSARSLVRYHETDLVYSDSVLREFESVKSRREGICAEAMEYIEEERLEEFEPSNPQELSSNDQSFIEEFIDALANLSPVEQTKRINKKLNQLQQGWEDLFLDPEPYLDGIPPQSRDGNLMRELEAAVSNSADRRIICDATEWCDQDFGEYFLTSDKKDILGRRDGVSEQGNRGSMDENDLPDTFLGFVEGDDRSKVEQINAIIERNYSESARLIFSSVPEFLSKYPIA